MKKQKIKRYRLGVSRYFPTAHKRKGQETFFPHKILKNSNIKVNSALSEKQDATMFFRDFVTRNDVPKIHTIRGNYELWAKRIKQVQEGKAVIELFYWAGKPYHRDENGVGQIVFATLDKDSGIGIQKLEFVKGLIYPIIDGIERSYDLEMPINDGLSNEDFKEWFKGYDLSKAMAIIHFTEFRY
jgi:hypothetical protein